MDLCHLIGETGNGGLTICIFWSLTCPSIDSIAIKVMLLNAGQIPARHCYSYLVWILKCLFVFCDVVRGGGG